MRGTRTDACQHPGARRHWTSYLFDDTDIRRAIKYVEGNPSKERLPAQSWSFVVPYDGLEDA